jgi:tRNA(adenine34) deaminase
MPSEADLAFMREALAEAALAPLHGDVPIGCVVIGADGQELARDHNRRVERADPTAHAEVLALRAAAGRVGRWRLDGSIVVVTLEPCAMCAGALVSARIARLVYAARDPKAGAVDTFFGIGRDARLNHRFTVEPDVLADEGGGLLSDFFAKLRAGKARGAR